MTTLLLIAVSLGVGITSSLQIAMLSVLNRARGPLEASWISMLASLGGMALVFVVASWAGAKPRLPAPFASSWIYATFAALLLGSLVLAARGLPFYLAGTGLLPIPYLLSAASIAPRIGLGVYLASIIAGQLIGAVAIEHTGALGTPARSIDPLRLLGIFVLLMGVALIRGRR